MSKIYIGVGHGGADGGAVCKARKEKDYALKIATAVSSLLKAAGHTVKQSRTADVTFPTNKKVPAAKAFGAELVVDIHLNAFNGVAHGTEVYYSAKSDKGKKLAEAMSVNISTTLNTFNRGAKTRLLSNGNDYYQVIRECPFATSLLAEICFIDNDNDMDKLDIDKAAQAIVAAVLTMFPAPIHTSSTTHSTTPKVTVKKAQQIKLKNVGLYGGISAKTPLKHISGTYYVYDGLVFSGFTRICPAFKNVGKMPTGENVTGYVKVSDIK